MHIPVERLHVDLGDHGSVGQQVHIPLRVPEQFTFLLDRSNADQPGRGIRCHRGELLDGPADRGGYRIAELLSHERSRRRRLQHHVVDIDIGRPMVLNLDVEIRDMDLGCTGAVQAVMIAAPAVLDVPQVAVSVGQAVEAIRGVVSDQLLILLVHILHTKDHQPFKNGPVRRAVGGVRR